MKSVVEISSHEFRGLNHSCLLMKSLGWIAILVDEILLVLVESRFLYFRIILVDWMHFFGCFNQLNFVLIHLNPTKIPWFFYVFLISRAVFVGPPRRVPFTGSAKPDQDHATGGVRNGSRWIGMGQMSICHPEAGNSLKDSCLWGDMLLLKMFLQ